VAGLQRAGSQIIRESKRPSQVHGSREPKLRTVPEPRAGPSVSAARTLHRTLGRLVMPGIGPSASLCFLLARCTIRTTSGRTTPSRCANGVTRGRRGGPRCWRWATRSASGASTGEAAERRKDVRLLAGGRLPHAGESCSMGLGWGRVSRVTWLYPRSFYFVFCEAAFDARYIHNFHILLVKDAARAAPAADGAARRAPYTPRPPASATAQHTHAALPSASPARALFVAFNRTNPPDHGLTLRRPRPRCTPSPSLYALALVVRPRPRCTPSHRLPSRLRRHGGRARVAGRARGGPTPRHRPRHGGPGP
jgi:hypothetical protein